MLDILSLMLIAKNRGNTLTFRLLKIKMKNCSGGLFIDRDDKDSPPSKLDIIRSNYVGVLNNQFTNVNGLKISRPHPH